MTNIEYDEIRKTAYDNTLNKIKTHSTTYGNDEKLRNSDDELCEMVFDIILNNRNIIFYVADYAIENIVYELNGKKNKVGLSVETKYFTMAEFIEYIGSIKNKTVIGLHELFVRSANDIEIRFYQKAVPDNIKKFNRPNLIGDEFTKYLKGLK